MLTARVPIGSAACGASLCTQLEAVKRIAEPMKPPLPTISAFQNVSMGYQMGGTKNFWRMPGAARDGRASTCSLTRPA
jgi:hypothetical protein